MDLKAKRVEIVSVCVTAAVFILAAFLCRPVFYLNDDVTMRSILSGSYTGVPDGHAVYMKYPLTWVLSVCFSLTDKVAWLELVFAGCLLWSVVELISAIKGEGKRMVWEILMGILFVLPFFWYMHYTIIAAVLAGTAVFLLCAGQNIKPVLFWLIAWMIRSQVAYLAIPFLAVALLWRMLGNQQKSLKTVVWDLGKAGGLALAGLLLCAGLNSLAYADSDWKEYLEYNDVRTELFDYTNFHSTEHYSENYEQYGMTQEEFWVLNSYNTMMDSTPDTEKLSDITQRVTTGMAQERDEAAWLKECVRQYYYQIRYGMGPYVILWLVLFVILTVLLLLARNWLGVCLTVCLGGGRSLVWIYLIYQGRFPERIITSLYVIEILLLAGMLWNLPAGCKERLEQLKQKSAVRWKGFPGVCMVSRVVLVIGAIGLLAWQVKTEIPRIEAQNEKQREWNVLKEYCEKNTQTLYLLDVFSAVEYGGFQYETDCENLMLAGGWMSSSPLAEQRFKDRGATDGGQALYEDTETAFLAEQNVSVEWLENYLTERFDKCTLQETEEIVCGDDKVFVEYRVVR